MRVEGILIVWQQDLCSYHSGPNLRLWTVFSVVKHQKCEKCVINSLLHTQSGI